MVTLGIRMIGRKARAFRSDRCRACERDVVSVRQRKWVWLSLFYLIPLLPLGFRNVWICQGCGESTEAQPRTSLRGKLLYLVLAMAIIAVGFSAPADPTAPDEEPPKTVFFVLGGVLGAYSLWKALRHERIATRAETLEGFEPVEFDACPLCNSTLEEQAAIAAWSVTRCNGCGLTNEPLGVAP